MEKLKKGLSLIVLIITILVTAILMSAVILSVKKQNITDSAGEVRFKEKIESYIVDLNDYISKQELEKGINYNKKLLNADLNSITYDNKVQNPGENLYSILTSMAEEDSKLFKVRNGNLIYCATGEDFSKNEFLYSVQAGLISYVSNGLVGYYEAANNAQGFFSNTTNIWKDLSLKGYDANINKITDNAWQEDFLQVSDDMSVTFPIKILNNTSFSLEVIYSPLDEMQNLFSINNEMLNLQQVAVNDENKKIYKITYIYNASEKMLYTYRENNELDNKRSVNINQDITSISIPNNANKKFYVIRVYNKVLTTDEITSNEIIDKLRFEL